MILSSLLFLKKLPPYTLARFDLTTHTAAGTRLQRQRNQQSNFLQLHFIFLGLPSVLVFSYQKHQFEYILEGLV
jgi:hypothetical protein